MPERDEQASEIKMQEKESKASRQKITNGGKQAKKQHDEQGRQKMANS